MNPPEIYNGPYSVYEYIDCGSHCHEINLLGNKGATAFARILKSGNGRTDKQMADFIVQAMNHYYKLIDALCEIDAIAARLESQPLCSVATVTRMIRDKAQEASGSALANNSDEQ